MHEIATDICWDSAHSKRAGCGLMKQTASECLINNVPAQGRALNVLLIQNAHRSAGELHLEKESEFYAIKS